MKRVIIAGIISGCILAGTAGIYAATKAPRDPLISGSGPITEQQIRDKLTAEGFSNIQISQQGSLFETTATKDGRAVKWEIDSRSGTVFQAGRTDDDRDDD
jgi:hypothetical protein